MLLLLLYNNYVFFLLLPCSCYETKRTSGGLHAPACCSTWWRPAGRGAKGSREGSRQRCVVINFWIFSPSTFHSCGWHVLVEQCSNRKEEEEVLLLTCLFFSFFSVWASNCWWVSDWNGFTDLWTFLERLGPLRYRCERRDATQYPRAAMGWVSTRLLYGCTVSMHHWQFAFCSC